MVTRIPTHEKKSRGILVSGGFVIAGNISSLSGTVREEICLTLGGGEVRPKVLRKKILFVHPGSARVLPGSCQGPARVPKVRRKNMIYCIQGPRTPFGFYNNKRSGGEGARSAIACAHVQRLALYRGHTAYGVITLKASL